MIDPLKDIDWNEVWKSRTRGNRESSPGRDCARIWESRESALRFWNMCVANYHRTEMVIQGTDITPDSRVLDIGAGPGTLAIPFAGKVVHVTAVEPAEGMCSVLKEKMAEFGRENIDIVQKRWEDVDVARDLQPPFDVVIASFSLGMPDIRAAIEKMMQASSRYIYLYHFAGPTSWDRQWQELWQKLHGRAYQPGPKSDVLYNVLYQMGIYPNVSAFRLEHNQPYASLDEAVGALAPQAQAETEEQKAVLREYLRGAMREEDGTLVMPGSSIRVKMWWEK
ncbi:MAG: class I SAM-dependent methyltransferase, partial [Methanothrix sp.]|nr:class I SAM-dependent methyltransferase [Methanothrix sp.]